MEEAPFKITIEAVLTHEYFLCMYGVLIWYLIFISVEKRIAIKNKKHFDKKKWWKLNSLDVLITFAIAPLVVVFDDEIVDTYNSFAEKDIVLGKLVYLCAGPVFNFLLRFVTGFKKV